MTRWPIAALAVLTSHAALGADAPAQLTPGSGDKIVSATCNACHTSDYIIMNSMFLTPDQWRAEVTKMRKVFGAPIDDDTAAEITAYLTANYAVAAKP